MATFPPETSTGSSGSPYDIAVIGAGPGGYVAAIRAAQMGARVLVIEKDELGGTCLNWGCIPTKSFLSDVKPLRKIKISPVYEGKEGLSLNLKKMVNRKNEVVSTMVEGIGTLFKSNHIQWVRGVASFLDSKTIGVVWDGKQETYTAKGIIIATGSKAGTIPSVSIDGRKVLSTNEILNIRKIPRDLVIIGGGVIGIQFATIFNALGTQVTVVEMLPNILAAEDDEIIRRLQRILEGDGITILTDTEVSEASPKRDKVEVEFQEKSGGKGQIRAERVLVATERTPCTEGLGLETIGLRKDGPFIEVNAKMETNVDGVYAVGDVIGKMMFAHAASTEGIIAAENIMGRSREIDYRRVPTCAYTLPEVASVGMREREARESGLDFRVGRFPYRSSGKALAMDEPEGLVKIIADKELGEIFGVHIIGENATELIGECILAMNLEAAVEDLAVAIKAHPTLSETIVEAALDWSKISIHQPAKKIPRRGSS
jgi:dihydrolipoamide dehydrogenase